MCNQSFSFEFVEVLVDSDDRNPNSSCQLISVALFLLQLLQYAEFGRPDYSQVASKEAALMQKSLIIARTIIDRSYGGQLASQP